jgi:acyl-CoA synthetase (AMP-forming)/AMP-acid ligase II
LFNGYWNCEADNAFTFRNGWHHTGDVGRFDADGYLWYVGRSPAKDLIKPGGENVYPAEVERAILEHSAIAEVVVIGVVDTQWGECVKAVCTCKPGEGVSAGSHRVRWPANCTLQETQARGICPPTATDRIGSDRLSGGETGTRACLNILLIT